MSELILYAVLFLVLIGHCVLAGKMYQVVHLDQTLSVNEKNDWKLKALVFPAYFWKQYQNR
jgi:hypothetical protein